MIHAVGDIVREQPPLTAFHYDSGGLVFGYRLSDGETVRLHELDEAASHAPVWLHLNLSDARARKWLEERQDIPKVALAMLLEPTPRVRLQLIDQHVAAIVEDLHHDFRGDPEGFGELRFFVDGSRVISVRRHPLQTVDQLRRQLQEGLTMSDTADWLELLVAGLSKSFGDVVHDLVDQVDALEDDIVAGTNKEQRARLTAIRRLLVRFRRHLSANRSALGRLRTARQVAAKEPSGMRQALDQLDGIASDLDLVHERVRVLQEEVAGQLAEATNRNLYLLSLVTTALLPATLLTGFWGMNVGGLPWHDSAHGGLWTGLSVLASIALSLLLLRGTRVL